MNKCEDCKNYLKYFYVKKYGIFEAGCGRCVCGKKIENKKPAKVLCDKFAKLNTKIKAKDNKDYANYILKEINQKLERLVIYLQLNDRC